MSKIIIAFGRRSGCRCFRAAVNAPPSKRSARFRAAGHTRSDWTAVASAPLLARPISTGQLVCLAFLLAWFPASAVETNSVAEPKEKGVDYLRTINERANKIVTTLGIAEVTKSNRVHEILVQQYRGLNDIQWVRDVEIGNAKAKFADDKAAANGAVQKARDAARPKLDKLHGEFLAKLAGELTSAQVDQVKDGMTYGVVPLTYGVYLKMYPDLTDEQKAQIIAWLTEARELAMDGSTSDEKHAVFGKYKGRINNYLSKAGYDAKKAEQNLRKPAVSGSEAKPK
jgi:hypothetical protein